MADEILIGTEGWRHAAWRGGFYPAELPVDWEFCYYSNRLRAVWLPVEAAEAGAAEIGEWLRDSDPAFRFVLSVAAARAAHDAWRAAFCARLEPLRPRLAGVVLSDPASVTAADARRLITALRALAPVCIDVSRDGRALLGDRAWPSVWDVDAEPTPPWHGASPAPTGLSLARMADGNPRAIRHALERLAAAPSTTAGLFFRPSRTAADYAESARTLAELLGV